jgi:predicted nucleic acid-binding protein
MPGTVIDSSIVAKWVLPEADSTSADAIVREAVRKAEPLFVLDLAFAEVANAIWKRQYRGLATIDEARQALDDFVGNRRQVSSRRL